METLLWIVAVVLVVTGIAGTILPMLPGVPLVFTGLLLAAWADGFHAVGWPVLAVLGVLTLVSLVVDIGASSIGARRAGATRAATMGAAVMVSYARAKSDAHGFTAGMGLAAVGVMPREIRLVILSLGLVLAGILGADGGGHAPFRILAFADDGRCPGRGVPAFATDADGISLDIARRVEAEQTQRRQVDAQPLVTDVAAAVDADPVAAFGETRARRLQRAQLREVAPEVGAVELGDQRRDRLVARVVRRAGEVL